MSLSDFVQHQHMSDSKRVRSMPVPPSPLDDRSDSPDGCPTSLFDRLPVELYIEIFTHCLAPLPRFDPGEAPLLIGMVSQAWRVLVLSVPKFWSSFEIEVTGSESPASLYVSYIERSMKLWLARSKNYPLTVSIVQFFAGQTQNEPSSRLLPLLTPEAHRWRSVQFIVPTTTMIPFPSHLPLLESLSFQPKGLCKSEPSLNISIANIPWYQLSQLDLQLEQNNLPTLNDTLCILSKTPWLRLCKLGVDCTLASGTDFDDLRLPVLEEFHLILQGANVFPFPPDAPAVALARFLHHISMPTLRALDITWLVQRPPLWPNCHLFVSFLRRISPTLKTLNLSYPPVSETELFDILTMSSRVTHLKLRFSLNISNNDLVSDDLLSLLTVRNPDGYHPILPSLMSLDLECSGSNFSYSALLAMVESRWKKEANPGDGFNHFSILSMKPTLRVVEKQVQLMICEGLDISVYAPPCAYH